MVIDEIRVPAWDGAKSRPAEVVVRVDNGVHVLVNTEYEQLVKVSLDDTALRDLVLGLLLLASRG